MATAFTRYVQHLAAHQGDARAALQSPELRYDLVVEKVMKAAISAGTTSDANWASSLVGYTDMTSEFVELVNRASVVGRIGARRVPFQTRIPVVESASAAQWVGENTPKPAASLSLESLLLLAHKIATITVLTNELVRFASPGSQATIERILINGISREFDRAFLDPDMAATSAHPASVLNGITATSSSGSTAAQISADLVTMLDSLVTSGSDLANVVLVAHPRTALTLATVLTTGGAKAFPSATARGGEVLGLPLLVSSAAQTDDSPQERILTAIDGNRVALADDGVTTVDAGRDASVQMVTNPLTGAQSLVSLWQNNMTGLRLERIISWASTDAARYMVVTF